MNVRLLAIILGAFGIGGAAAFALQGNTLLSTSSNSRTTGKALIGGAFSMVDHRGKAVTDKDLLGRHSLVFFGFTHCPDICPATLQVASEALERLGSAAEKIQPIFVSVDPERDTPEVLRTYLEDFDPRVMGLTGSVDQVAGMAKAYRIFHSKVQDENSADGYTVDHSAYMYLMSPKGVYVTHYPPAIQADALAEKLAPLL